MQYHRGADGTKSAFVYSIAMFFNNFLCSPFLCVPYYINSHPLKTIFQHKACTDKLYADSFYKVQKNSHSSFEVICCRS